MIRRPPRSTLSSSSAASDVYKRQLRGSFSKLRPSNLIWIMPAQGADTLETRAIHQMKGTKVTTSAQSSSTSTPIRSRFQWRVIDIVVASIIGVASGLIFVVWNVASSPAMAPFSALLPGLQAIGGGFWLFAGVLTALVIRKPG